MEMEDKIHGKSNRDGPVFMVDFSVIKGQDSFVKWDFLGMETPIKSLGPVVCVSSTGSILIFWKDGQVFPFVHGRAEALIHPIYLSV